MIFQAMRFFLFGYQMSFRNLHFFFHRITAQVNDLQPVAQCRLNIIDIIGSSNEQHFAQIIFQFQVIIVKSMVLFGVQALQAMRDEDRRGNPFLPYLFHRVSLPDWMILFCGWIERSVPAWRRYMFYDGRGSHFHHASHQDSTRTYFLPMALAMLLPK